MFDRRHQGVRTHAFYLVYLSVLVDHKAQQWNVVRREVETIFTSFITLGVVYQQFGWHVAPRIQSYDGRRSLGVAFVVASQVLRFDHVAIVGACGGVVTMQVLAQYDAGEVIVWCRGNGANGIIYYTCPGKDIVNQFFLKR